LLGATAVREVRLIDAEASTVSAAADKAMWIDSGAFQWILHPDLLSGRDLTVPRKIWWYNSVFHKRHDCLVRSVLLLLRPAADGADITGSYDLQFPDEAEAYHVFRYRVLRLWKLPVQRLLTGGVGILPLAPLTDDAARALPAVVSEIDRRLRAEAEPEEADKLRAATTVLMGLRHPAELVDQILQGVMTMTMWEKIYADSSVVQEMLKREGRKAEERGEQAGAIGHARRQLLRLGQAKFGPPAEETAAALNAIGDLDRLDALAERLLTVNSWNQLLASHEG